MVFNINFLPLIMFILSIIGIILNRSNIILILICIEIMLLSVSINFLLHSLILNTIIGQIMSIYIITVAAVESAIGLSIMISFYKLKGSISIRYLNLLKG
uniref:NADH-ubiquinone oxidoreductase chain 4L n=1 Tax=Clava multicornis TaxID=498518 RepID=G9ISD8_CLAMU|nr:NADH dehydrogenase subunit 4L [Clava multicornis]AER54464.1 NADH dehydrogenase subunit 4L [Clava multicornis]